jgi:hypothetical protein
MTNSNFEIDEARFAAKGNSKNSLVTFISLESKIFQNTQFFKDKLDLKVTTFLT